MKDGMAVAASMGTSYILTKDGVLKALGNNSHAQLGTLTPESGVNTVMNLSLGGGEKTLSDRLKSKLSASLAFVLGIPDALVKSTVTHIETNDVYVRPFTQNGRTLVPARFITESLGGTVTWDEKTSTGMCVIGSNTVKFVLDSKTMTVNGKAITLEVPAQTVGGRTMLPLRAFAEGLGQNVTWDGERELILVSPTAQTYSPQEMSDIVGLLRD